MLDETCSSNYEDNLLLWKALDARVTNPVINSRHRDSTSYQPYEHTFELPLHCETKSSLLYLP